MARYFMEGLSGSETSIVVSPMGMAALDGWTAAQRPQRKAWSILARSMKETSQPKSFREGWDRAKNLPTCPGKATSQRSCPGRTILVRASCAGARLLLAKAGGRWHDIGHLERVSLQYFGQKPNVLGSYVQSIQILAKSRGKSAQKAVPAMAVAMLSAGQTQSGKYLWGPKSPSAMLDQVQLFAYRWQCMRFLAGDKRPSGVPAFWGPKGIALGKKKVPGNAYNSILLTNQVLRKLPTWLDFYSLVTGKSGTPKCSARRVQKNPNCTNDLHLAWQKKFQETTRWFNEAVKTLQQVRQVRNAALGRKKQGKSDDVGWGDLVKAVETGRDVYNELTDGGDDTPPSGDFDPGLTAESGLEPMGEEPGFLTQYRTHLLVGVGLVAAAVIAGKVIKQRRAAPPKQAEPPKKAAPARRPVPGNLIPAIA